MIEQVIDSLQGTYTHYKQVFVRHTKLLNSSSDRKENALLMGAKIVNVLLLSMSVRLNLCMNNSAPQAITMIQLTLISSTSTV